MSDPIDRQTAIDAVSKALDRQTLLYGFVRKVTLDAIKNLPSTQPERKRGHWIIDGHHIKCNQCSVLMCKADREGDAIPRNFCPNCGADMRGEQDDR